jgi:hypothetical protein
MKKKIIFLPALLFIACSVFHDDGISSYAALGKRPVHIASVTIYSNESSSASSIVRTISTSTREVEGEDVYRIHFEYYNEYGSKILLRSKPEGEEVTDRINTGLAEYDSEGKLLLVSLSKGQVLKEEYIFTYDEDGRLTTLHSKVLSGLVEEWTDVIQYVGSGVTITRTSDIPGRNRTIGFTTKFGELTTALDGVVYSSYSNRYGNDENVYYESSGSIRATDEFASATPMVNFSEHFNRTIFGIGGNIELDEKGTPDTYREFFFHPLMIAGSTKSQYSNYLLIYSFDWWHPLEFSPRAANLVTIEYGYEH